MSDLVAWLRGVLDEVERIARAAVDAVADHGGSQVWPDVRAYLDDEVDALDAFAKAATPARVLHKVEAERRILDEYEKALDRRRLFRDDVASAGALLQMVAVVKLLALPYADRPGYREEWRP